MKLFFALLLQDSDLILNCVPELEKEIDVIFLYKLKKSLFMVKLNVGLIIGR